MGDGVLVLGLTPRASLSEVATPALLAICWAYGRKTASACARAVSLACTVVLVFVVGEVTAE